METIWAWNENPVSTFYSQYNYSTLINICQTKNKVQSIWYKGGDLMLKLLTQKIRYKCTLLFAGPHKNVCSLIKL